ncbi:MAG: tRNA (adenosine(37)-N6)-dimethylallyltransferase MiaA [Caldimonas sp.]
MVRSALGVEIDTCLCLAGPTASGKSAAALAIAAAFAPRRPVEIVSVDSAIVYRGMDIGTAKPSHADRDAVPHHLVDIADPAERYSAARFVADASEAIAAIRSRGALPLLVGGTMLYFKALFDGLDELPGADPTIRAELDERAAREGWPALHRELAAVDPESAARLAPRDGQRIQRALEVHGLTGRPLSHWHTAAAGRTPPLIALEPTERGWLHARIADRFAAMLEAGFVDEVRALRARDDLHADLPSMRAVGYRQAWAALDDDRLDALASTSTAATRQLAKRQLTWLRGLPWRERVACDEPEASARVVAIAERWFAEGRLG